MSKPLPFPEDNLPQSLAGASVTEVTSAKQRRPWRKTFLRALAKTGNVTRSCQLAGISKMHAYRVYHKSARFAEAWDNALEASIDVLEGEARRRAMQEDRDALLMFLLRGLRSKVYGDKRKLEHSGENGTPIQIDAKSTALSVSLEDIQLVRQLLCGGNLPMPD